MDKVFFQSVDACIDELMVRFIINAPEYELVFDDNYRPMFLFEKAFYYYKDYTYHHGVQLTMGELIKEFFSRTDLLKLPPNLTFDEYRESYTDYRAQINVCGGILVSDDKRHVLLIKENFNKWGLPKGKIDGCETDEQCAEREIFEETGYRSGDLTGCNRVVVKFPESSKKGIFFIVEKVPKSTFFSPAVKGEIKAIQWFDVNTINNSSFTKATREAISSYKSLISAKKSGSDRKRNDNNNSNSSSGGDKKKEKDKGGNDKKKILIKKFSVCVESPKLTVDVDSTVDKIFSLYFVN